MPAPYSFLFGNEIDTHQQTRRIQGGDLFGYFYISFTGVVTKDGYRVATHLDCNANPCTARLDIGRQTPHGDASCTTWSPTILCFW